MFYFLHLQFLIYYSIYIYSFIIIYKINFYSDYKKIDLIINIIKDKYICIIYNFNFKVKNKDYRNIIINFFY